MTRFRFVACPVCHGDGQVILVFRGREEPSGCVPCGGNLLECGRGRIGITFERSTEVDASLAARSGKEQQ